MRAEIRFSDANEPYAVRAVAFGRDNTTCLVGRHSPNGTRLLCTISILPFKWMNVYERIPAAAVLKTRYCDSHQRIAFINEQYEAYVISATGMSSRRPERYSHRTVYLSSAKNASFIALSGERVGIWDVVTSQLWWPRASSQEIYGERPQQTVVALDDGGRFAAVALPSGSLRLLDFRKDVVVRTLQIPLNGIDELAVDDRIRWVAAIGKGARGSCVVDLHGNGFAGQIFSNPEQNGNTAQALHPTKDMIAYGTIVGYVVLVDLTGNKILYMEKLNRTRVWDLNFSSDGTRLAVAGDDGRVTIIDLEEMVALGMTRMRQS